LARHASQSDTTNLPLLRLEPILRQYAEERNPGKVLFNHFVVDFEEKDDHVLVTVKHPNGEDVQYRTQYVYAADGGKLSAQKLGITMEGPKKIVDFVSTHFKADLSDYWDGKSDTSQIICS
jgi:2,4-dichlorophenol 6-monooxygenase